MLTRNRMASALKIKCPTVTCCNILAFGTNLCNLCVNENDQNSKEISDNSINSIRNVIAAKIVPLALQKRQYYVGVTICLKERTRRHKTDLKKVGIKGSDVIMEEIMTVKGSKPAYLLERSFIAECLLNNDINEYLLNNGIPNGTNVNAGRDGIRSLYLRYLKSDSKIGDLSGYSKGNLSREQMVEVFTAVVEAKGITQALDEGSMIKFGVTSIGGYADRLCRYNVQDYAPGFVFDQLVDRYSAILLRKDQKFTLKNGVVVTLNSMDIYKFEILSIAEFTTGGFARYSPQLMNVTGGGDGGCRHTEIIYFLFAKKIQGEHVTKENEKYHEGPLPERKQSSNIDWNSLVPWWKVGVHCKLMLKEPIQYEGQFFSFPLSFIA